MNAAPVSEIDATAAGLVLTMFLHPEEGILPSLPFDGMAHELDGVLTAEQHLLLQETGLTPERALAATIAPLLDLGAADWDGESREVRVTPQGVALLRAVTTDTILDRVRASMAFSQQNGGRGFRGAAPHVSAARRRGNR